MSNDTKIKRNRDLLPELQVLLESGTIVLEEALVLNMKAKEKLLIQAGIDLAKISYRDKNGDRRYYINLGREIAQDYGCKAQFSAVTRDSLIEKLYDALIEQSLPTLTEAFEEWMRFNLQELFVCGKTLKEYRCEWTKFFKDCSVADKRIDRISPDDMKSVFRTMCKDGNITKKRFTTARSVLNGIFRHYLEQIPYNPLDRINYRELKLNFAVSDKGPENYFEADEVYLIYTEAIKSDDPYCLAIAFACNVALRIGEIRALKYSDYNLSKQTLRIERSARRDFEATIDKDGHVCTNRVIHITVPRLKGGCESAARTIDIPSDAAAIIEKAHGQNPDSEYLFTFKGRQLSPDTFNRRLKSICEKVKVPYHSSHKMRFFNASRYYEAFGLSSTSRILGHSTTAQTLHYITPAILNENDQDYMHESMSISNLGNNKAEKGA